MQNFYTFNHLSQYTSIQHLVTKKEPTEAYSFSLALHTDENPNQIIDNRQKLQKIFPFMKFIVANQTHSSNIIVIDKPIEQGWNTIKSAIRDCDALITNQKEVMLTILTADCVPILLFDPIEQVVAIIHAGWKGTQQEIAKKTVEKMSNLFNSKSKNILAGIAPSIGKCCYEVDWNVSKNFQDIPNAYTQKGEKQMLDLPYINKVQLLKAGLENKNIEMSNICTACEVEEYFSYRREAGCSGRFMSMIGIQ